MAIVNTEIAKVFIRDDEETGLPLYRRFTDVLIHANKKNIEVKYDEFLLSNDVEINKKQLSYFIVDKEELTVSDVVLDENGNIQYETYTETINTGNVDENGLPITVEVERKRSIVEQKIIQQASDRYSYWFQQLGEPVIIPQINQTLLTL